MNIEDNIWQYGHLPRAEQEEIDAFVEKNPEYTAVLEEVKSMYALLDETQAFISEPYQDLAIAYYIASQFLAHHPLPAVLRASFETMEQRIDQDSDLRRRYDDILQRMDRIASSGDPLEQFEALTGHTLGMSSTLAAGRGSERPSYAPDRKPGRRGYVAGKRLVGWRRLAAAGLVFATSIVLLFLLFSGNRIDRLAYTDPALLLLDGYDPIARSDYRLPASASVDQQFIYGQAALRDAQHAWLGFYYTFEQDRLDQAGVLFERVLAGSSERSILVHEATFYLGKIALANHDIEQARIHLQKVAGSEGPRSRHAAELLARL